MLKDGDYSLIKRRQKSLNIGLGYVSAKSFGGEYKEMAISSRLVGDGEGIEDGKGCRFNESILYVREIAPTVEFWHGSGRVWFKYYSWDDVQLTFSGILSDLTNIDSRIFTYEDFRISNISLGITATVIMNSSHILSKPTFAFVEVYDFAVLKVPEFNDLVIKLLIFFAGVRLIFLENVYDWYFREKAFFH